MKPLCFILLALFATATSFAQQYIINATFTGFPDGTHFILKDLDADAAIDSAVISNNQFTLKGSLADAPSSLWLHTELDKKFYYVSLLLGSEQVYLKGDIKDFPYNIKTTGSTVQQGADELMSVVKDNYQQREQLVNEFFSLQNDSGEIKSKAIWGKIKVLDSINNSSRKQFIYKQPNTYASVREMYYLKNVLGKDSLKALFQMVHPTLQQSKFGTRIANYLKVGDPLQKGDRMLDFEATDQHNQRRRFSESSGKYILLDFTATYCGPCIGSMSDLKSLAANYKDKLSIISISGDAGKKTWLEGITRDQPTWASLWDGKGIYSETMIKYGVNGFPKFCLIAPNGTIIDMWSGYGKNPDGKGSLETAVIPILEKSPVQN